MSKWHIKQWLVTFADIGTIICLHQFCQKLMISHACLAQVSTIASDVFASTAFATDGCIEWRAQMHVKTADYPRLVINSSQMGTFWLCPDKNLGDRTGLTRLFTITALPCFLEINLISRAPPESASRSYLHKQSFKALRSRFCVSA